MPTIYVQANNVLPMICDPDGFQRDSSGVCSFRCGRDCRGSELTGYPCAGDRCQRLVKTIEGHGKRGEIAILRSYVPSMSGTPKNACPIFSSHSGKASLCVGFPEVIALGINVCWAYAEDAMARIPNPAARGSSRSARAPCTIMSSMAASVTCQAVTLHVSHQDRRA